MSIPFIGGLVVDEAVADHVSSEAFRARMSRLGAAVNIITTDGPAGRAGYLRTLRRDRSVHRSIKSWANLGLKKLAVGVSDRLYWSEWQDSNLRLQRPEPGDRAA
jgi:hypothetical protein